MKNLELILLLTFLFFFSCNKEENLDSEFLIKKLSVVVKEHSRKYELRLAFGKTLARALTDIEFRQYIKSKSEFNDTIFNELIYNIIKDDKLPSGKTISQLMYEYEDEEVKSLFGDSLQEIIRVSDPLICIKIPDIFIDLDWNINNVIPFVGVETPTPLLYPNANGKYMFYYYNGYRELLQDKSNSDYENIKYFYLMVKYSDDYLLINKNALTNEKGLPFFEFLPQLRINSSNIVKKIFDQSLEIKEEPGWYYMKKIDCFKTWQNDIGYKGEFYLDSGSGCTNLCPRECVPSELKHNVIIDNYFLKNDIIFQTLGTFFNESMHISIAYTYRFADLTEIWKRFTIIGYRFKELGLAHYSSSLRLEKIKSDGSVFDIPRITVNYLRDLKNIKKIPLQLQLTDNFQKGEYIYFCKNSHFYQDYITDYDNSYYCYDPDNFDIVHSFYTIGQGAGDYSWCFVGTETSGGNISTLNIKY